MAFDHTTYCRTNPKMLEVDENTDPVVELQNNEDRGFDEILINAVKCYPHLYDSSSTDYRDTIKKENSWVEISRVTNKSPDACCNRWNRLRESFSKEKKKRLLESKSGSGASRRRGFTYFESMKFIDKFVKSRSSVTNVNRKKKLSHSTCSETNIEQKVSNWVQQGKRALEEEEEAVPLQENNPHVFRPICKRRAGSISPTVSSASNFDEAILPSCSWASEFEETVISISKAVAEHLNATKDEKLTNDAETAFCNLILAELKKMEEDEKKVKMQEILQILWRKSNL